MLKRAGAFVILLVAVACGGGNSTTTSPSPTSTPNFQGQYTGSYVTSGCAETVLIGLCQALGFGPSGTLSLTLSLVQNQTAVTGTITVGAPSRILPSLGSSTMGGTFQGLIQSSGHLTGSAAMNAQFCVTAPVDPQLPGGGGYQLCPNSITASAWDTNISGNSLTGTFTLVFGATSPTAATATVSTSLSQVTRQ
jgi:hypothetical protein